MEETEATQFNRSFDRPYIISWNLTYRCNLACEHCYLDAGPVRKVHSEEFSDRSELQTEECFRVIDQIQEIAPESVTILTGGEPLLRKDILSIVRYASEKKLWVVIGTNGVRISKNLTMLLKEAGARGMALSLDALKPEVHDRFRAVKGAWDNTVSGARILAEFELPFIIQTTVGRHNLNDLEGIADFAHGELGARVWNLYFLVQTGRGQFVSDITSEEYETVLSALAKIQKKFFSKMMVNAKCAPHYVRKLFEDDKQSPFLKTFSSGAGGCPAGTHYMGIRPNGDMTPCPYLPVFGGNLRQQSFREIWQESEVFKRIREKSLLQDRCGTCEFGNHCGGCRARAFGVTGDYMGQDPLCDYQPGKYQKEQIVFGSGIEYGEAVIQKIAWDEAAQQRIERVPRFVRGMVVKAVETYCVQHQIQTVTVQELEAIRAKIPTQKLFNNNS